MFSSNSPFEAERFSDLVGNLAVVQALQRRVSMANHAQPLLLHGPPSVGKRTFARVYSKAVLCRHPAGDQSACGECDRCRWFAEGRQPNYVEFDGAGGCAADELVAIASSASVWEGRRVVTILNADGYPPKRFDVFLKTLEENSMPTTFILTTKKLLAIRLAGRSRSQMLHMKPLDSDRSTELAHSALVTRAQLVGQGVSELVAAFGNRTPGRILTTVKNLRPEGPLIIPAVVNELRLHWVAAVRAYLKSVLYDDHPKIGDPPLANSVAAIRDTWLDLGKYVKPDLIPRDFGSVQEYIDDGRADLLKALTMRATALQTTPLDVWKTLATYFASDGNITVVRHATFSFKAFDFVARNGVNFWRELCRNGQTYRKSQRS